MQLGRGVNILSGDPIWQSRSEARLTERHLALIRQAGFDHVRINLHPFRDGALDPDPAVSGAWFETLAWAVDAALASGLAVVLDVHEYEVMGRDPTGHRRQFLDAWARIALRFRQAPPQVVYELLNEPSGRLTAPLWNEYLGEALAVVRAVDPVRTVIVGPARSNRIAALDDLRLPAADRHIVVTVHYYLPFRFTHQGASWAGLAGQTGVRWTGTPAQRTAISDDLARAQVWAVHHDRPVYLGEFGAYESAGLSDRVSWTSFLAREAERLGWSWAYWQFDGDFVVYDVPADRWVEPIRDALLPGPG
ncbi:MAG: glycoside hydrolase family 5 protein [Candidatus Nanopelagicales bacterium]